jgi:transposase
LTEGLSPSAVAGRLGVSERSVLRWQKAYREKGAEALRRKPVPGRPPKLDPKHIPRLREILLEGALAYGFPNDMWTLERIAAVIRREFGVKYHPSHVWKILRKLRWSCQVPERRAIQRNEKVIAHWKRYKWPAIKKSP